MSSYASTADIAQLASIATALSAISSADQQAALDAASNRADGYLATQFTLPLIAWTSELKDIVCAIAVYRLMKRRGYAASSKDQLIRLDFEEAIKWLEDVRDGKIAPVGLKGSDNNVGDVAGAPMVSTDSLRGWQNSPPNSTGIPTPDNGWG